MPSIKPRWMPLVAAAVMAGACVPSQSYYADPDERADAAPGENHPAYVLNFEMERIEGEKERLDKYKGKVVLLVNTASRCGLTPQYEALEKLYRDRKDDGLMVLGFPANDFRNQEPGTNEQILEFCRERFDVTFPLFARIGVVGEDAHPLYKRLAAQPEPLGGEPRWNFTKFLVDREGRVVARFEPGVRPDDERLTSKVEELLATSPTQTSGQGS